MTMIPINDLLEAATDPQTNVLDLEVVNAQMTVALEQASEAGFGVNPQEMILINERFVDVMLDYMGNLFLQFVDELGALPKGLDAERINFQLFKTHSKIAAVYELARTKETIDAARSGLVVPGQSTLIHPGQLELVQDPDET